MPRQTAGHKVLAALDEPLDVSQRVEKTYAETTPSSSASTRQD
ncbi:hypothetical protein [Haladaptatus sp. NG-SE-30]